MIVKKLNKIFSEVARYKIKLRDVAIKLKPPKKNKNEVSYKALKPLSRTLSSGSRYILLVGEGAVCREVDSYLQILYPLATKQVSSLSQASSLFSQNLELIVFCGVQSEAKLNQWHEALEEMPAWIPMMILVPDHFYIGFNTFYNKGVCQAFKWPQDSADLPYRIVSVIEKRRQKIQEGSFKFYSFHDCLHHQIESQVGSEVAMNIQLVRRDGAIEVTGSVNFFWQWKMIDQLLRQSYGIRSVENQLSIYDDTFIKSEALDQIVDEISKLDDDVRRSLYFFRDGGRLRVVGSIRRPSVMLELNSLFRKLRQEVKIDHQLVVSPDLQRKECRLARAIEAAIEPVQRPRVIVSVVGTTAVIDGKAESFKKKEDILNIIQEHRQIQHIVDRVEIAA